jgi:serine/threonine-protein kinase
MVRTSTDEAVLIDFGIAREFIADVTQTHTSVYTLGFAPVEQYDDRAHRGEFTDVYALATTLATLVSGRSPQASFNRAMRDNFQIPTGVSSSVQEAIRQGMIVNPEDRTQTMEKWLDLLQVSTQKVQTPARYQHLERLLQTGDWRGADKETAKQMLAVANQTEQGWLEVEDTENFPCEDLRAIDGLWVKYSNGRFGFSVQKRIYQSLGGTRKYDKRIWNTFGDRVGWRKNDEWQDYNDLIFSTKAP